jgi:hypothetical protein
LWEKLSSGKEELSSGKEELSSGKEELSSGTNGHIQNVYSMCIKINKVGKQEVGI